MYTIPEERIFTTGLAAGLGPRWEVLEWTDRCWTKVGPEFDSEDEAELYIDELNID